MADWQRHWEDHGFITEAGYICDGCMVLGLHEHKCHEDSAGPQCVCEQCHPSEDELAEFARSLGIDASAPSEAS